MNEIASNYAEALIGLAKENNCVEAFKDEVDTVNAVLDSVEGLKQFFASVKVSKEEKKKVLVEAFDGKVNTLVLNFLKVLVDKGRMNFYPDIFKQFHSLANLELNIQEGIVESARPLDEKQIERLEKALGENVELKPRINENLISGFKIIMDNQIIDNSMRDKINDLTSLLKERR